MFFFGEVFVHFTAAWCVPSIAMNAFFEELAIKYQNIIMFLLVDVDDVKVPLFFFYPLYLFLFKFFLTLYLLFIIY